MSKFLTVFDKVFPTLRCFAFTEDRAPGSDPNAVSGLAETVFLTLLFSCFCEAQGVKVRCVGQSHTFRNFRFFLFNPLPIGKLPSFCIVFTFADTQCARPYICATPLRIYLFTNATLCGTICIDNIFHGGAVGGFD